MGDWFLHASYQNIRHLDTQTQAHLDLFPVAEWINGFGWHSVLRVCVCVSLVLRIWLCICAKCKQLSHCDVWIGDDNPALWMRSAENNLLCFLCAPRVHFLSNTIQTRQMTEYPSLSHFPSPAEIFLLYPLISCSTPFAKDYLSYKFWKMDHVVLEWQRIQHLGFEIVGMSKPLLL